MTIHTPPTGYRKEFGEIGFHEEHGATYLVFPRSLPRHAESRVVGINYQLAEDASVKGSPARPQSPNKRARKSKEKHVAVRKSSPKAPKPEPRIYNIVIRRTAVLEEIEKVKAFTQEQARENALQSIKHKRFVLSRAVQRNEIVSSTEPP